MFQHRSSNHFILKHISAKCLPDIVILIVQGNQTCTALGNNIQGTAPSTQTYGLFINTVDTTNCTGNATAWNVCYYNSTSAFFSNTQFGVYRPLPGSTNYTLVPGSLSSYYVIRGSSIYTCTKYPIAQQFVVQPGDVIFACLQQNLQLGVIGNVSGYPGYSVLRADATASSISSCSSVVTNLINVTVGYSTLTGLALHVKLGKPDDVMHNSY